MKTFKKPTSMLLAGLALGLTASSAYADVASRDGVTRSFQQRFRSGVNVSINQLAPFRQTRTWMCTQYSAIEYKTVTSNYDMDITNMGSGIGRYTNKFSVFNRERRDINISGNLMSSGGVLRGGQEGATQHFIAPHGQFEIVYKMTSDGTLMGEWNMRPNTAVFTRFNGLSDGSLIIDQDTEASISMPGYVVLLYSACIPAPRTEDSVD